MLSGKTETMGNGNKKGLFKKSMEYNFSGDSFCFSIML